MFKETLDCTRSSETRPGVRKYAKNQLARATRREARLAVALAVDNAQATQAAIEVTSKFLPSLTRDQDLTARFLSLFEDEDDESPWLLAEPKSRATRPVFYEE